MTTVHRRGGTYTRNGKTYTRRGTTYTIASGTKPKPKTKAKPADTWARPPQTEAEFFAQQEKRLAAQEKQMRYDNMVATMKRQRRLGIPERVSPSDYEDFFDGPGKLKPRPAVPVSSPPWPAYNPAAKSKVKDTTPKPKWPVYDPDPSWKHKSPMDMNRREYDAYIDELHNSSSELTLARARGWREFFRTLFGRKR